MNDSRIPEVRNIIESMCTSSYYEFIHVYINNNTLAFIVDDTVLYITELKTIGEYFGPIVFKYSDIVNFTDETECIIDYNILNSVINKYNTYINYSMNNPVLYTDLVLRDNEQFETLLNLKADQGLKFFKVYDANNNCIEIPMFAGFLSSNKQDKIGITVNDLLDNHLLIHYTIFKKKINRNIHMYYRILKLN